jgi:hypothetical protein
MNSKVNVIYTWVFFILSSSSSKAMYGTKNAMRKLGNKRLKAARAKKKVY